MDFTQASQLPTQDEISQLQDASLVTNTERNMSKWIRTLNRFNKCCDLKKGHWFKSNRMRYGKLRKMMNDIATSTDINLDNGRLITNHSCCHTAIQLLKNNSVPESELQAFSGHRSCESLADYCQTSDDQRIMNTAMLIPFSSQDLDLDEYEYDNFYGGFPDEELDSDNGPYDKNNDSVQSISTIQENQAQNLTEAQLSATDSQYSNITKEIPSSTQSQSDTIIHSDFMAKEIKKSSQVLRIPKIKPHTKSSSYPTSSVTTPFKPPYPHNSPMLELYGKRRKPLSSVNNIVIQLPPGTSQSYNLNINLKIN
ncbi:6052_t:CDS:2 [Dentiscutata erythropus]|uniref:6052_t:CDS:1 n=1 Tax=Dentiscutata erythropus TaxID=1348616 RepID=A0A9N9HDB1_9GLOM|nr:6052_t:CDS:2 [Dentiscutata erythropus]